MLEKIRVLGIDVGYAKMGWSIIQSYLDRKIILKLSKIKQDIYNIQNLNSKILDLLPKNFIDAGLIETSKDFSYEDRVAYVFENVKNIIELYKPNSIAIERVFFFKNQKTVINVVHIQGVLKLLNQLFNIPIYEYTPLQVKHAITGYGVSKKKEVSLVVKSIFDIQNKYLLSLDDLIDSIAVATCHIKHVLESKIST